MDYKEIRQEVCKGCKYKNKRHPDSCTIYEESAIDYHKKSCRWREEQDGDRKD